MSESNYGNVSNQGSKFSEQDEEERKADAELATKMSNYIDPAIDKIKPLLKLINEVRGWFIVVAILIPRFDDGNQWFNWSCFIY